MALVRLTVPEHPRAFVEGSDNFLADEDTRDGCVSASESLADGLDIGNYALLFPGVEGATASHAAHDLV